MAKERGRKKNKMINYRCGWENSTEIIAQSQ